jgi:4-amino-4-deoxy-L-arabinose transferase-like glycosyltransferase
MKPAALSSTRTELRERDTVTEGRRRPPASLILAFAIPLILLLPFSNKAFHIDDPAYLWTARHLLESPLDFYGFDANWFGRDQPMYEINQNPPGLPYTLALVGRFTGFGEFPMHLVTAFFASLFCGGTWLLAERLCRHPMLASLVALFSPVTLVSGNLVMTDIPMLACFVWAVYLWIRAAKSCKPGGYFLASLCIALAMFYKYFGLTALPLVLAYSLVRERRLGRWAFHLILPSLAFAAYQLWTQQLYGFSMFAGAATFAREFSHNSDFDFMRPRVLIGMSFAGGTLIGSLSFVPYLWSKRVLAGGIAVAAAAMGGVYFYSETLLYRADPSPEIIGLLSLHYAIFVLITVQMFSIAVSDLRRTRSPESLLLFLWLLGTFLFATYLNWSITARTVLPMIVPGAILLVRRLERLEGPRPFLGTFKPYALLLPALILSLWVTYGDYAFADTGRRAADHFARVDEEYPARYWFEGHFGFQYYMQEHGIPYFTKDRETDIRLNDRIAHPTWSSVQPRYNRRFARAYPQLGLVYPNPTLITTQHPLRCAGFYTSLFGPLPYFIGPTLPVEYMVYHVGNYEDP